MVVKTKLSNDMEQEIKATDKSQQVAGDAYGPTTNESKPAGRGRRIAYWVITALISFELVQGALWDFDLLNQGYINGILEHLGYPLYLGPVLGACKLLAVAIILVPGWLLLKEWAYAGLTILFTGAFVSHEVVGDALGQSIWSLLFGILVIGSWALRPANRRISPEKTH